MTERQLDTDIALMTPVPVKLQPEDLQIIQTAAEFTAVFSGWTTISYQGIPAETQPAVFLPADLRRRRCYFKVNLANVVTGVASNNTGSVTSPTAGQNIAQRLGSNIVPGWYIINWEAGESGTLAAVDVNNMQLFQGATLLATANVPGAGNFNQAQYGPVFLSGASAVSVKATSTATVGAVYNTQFTLQPVANPNPNSGYVLIGQLGEVSNGKGGQVFAGQNWETHAHSQLYIAGDGVTPLTVTMEVERDQEP